MVQSLIERFAFEPDQFALYFDTDQGIEIRELANFLNRLSTVTRGVGAEVRVVGIYPGSLTVLFKAAARSKVARNAASRFVDDPVDATTKASALVILVVGAIAGAVAYFEGAPPPAAKAGAQLITNGTTNTIQIVTGDKTIVIMDSSIADHVQKADRERRADSIGAAPDRVLSSPETRIRLPDLSETMDAAKQGKLVGVVRDLDGLLYFKPDGYAYMVPVEGGDRGFARVLGGARYRVTGEITTKDGFPNTLKVRWAEKLPTLGAIL